MTRPKADIHFLLKNPIALFAFGFGSGLSPKMPGTVGTLAAIPIYLSFHHFSMWAVLSIIVVSFFLGIWFCGVAADRLGVHDHGGIVWDEFVGYWIAMIGAPAGWLWIVIGFVLFRFFDILKPWPISLADKKLHGGFGVMFDDVLAGIAAAISLQGIYYFGFVA